MKKIDKLKFGYASLVVFIVALFLFFSYVRAFDEFEYSTLDFRYLARPPLPVDKDIVIIEVGDDSIEKIGKWPFPRSYHTLLINALRASGVKTVVFDIFFSEHKEGDDEFARAVKDAGNVYMPYIFELNRTHPDPSRIYASGHAAPLIDSLHDAAHGVGFINVKPDIDGKVRRIPPFIEYEGTSYPHMTVLSAVNELGYDWKDVDVTPGKRLIIGGEVVVPLEEDSSILVNYPDGWGKAFRHYSYVDILQSYLADVTGQEPILDLTELEGTTCFIGLTATASPDAHPSPTEPLYPGIGVHTSVFNSFMYNSYLFRLNRWWNLLILIVLGIVTGIITSHSRKRIALLGVIVEMAAYFIIALILFWPFGIWVDVFFPLVTIACVYVIITFKKYVTETQKRELLEKELNIAKEIQESFLPVEMPKVGSLEVSVRMLTALQVGGDLYDVVQLDEDRLGVMFGDVSGKGVPAALFMAKVVSVFKMYVKEGDASKVVKLVNERLSSESRSNLFVTLTYMIFNTKTNTAEYAIGGHMPTLVIKPTGEVELLDVEEGLPLGLISSEFSEEEYKYEPGTMFVLYTDGVTEAMDLNDNMFGQDRLVELGKRMKGYTASEVVEALHSEVAEFAGKAKQHDDITIMAIKT